jgi:hypothetical protein
MIWRPAHFVGIWKIGPNLSYLRIFYTMRSK